VRLADGFGLPVGLDGQSYYKARGFRPNGHLGEDWNGKGGGDTDLGAPVYSTGHGLVVFARDYRAGWGNVVIIRHAYMENGRTEFADSLYGHLDEILVKENQQVTRGQKIGTIGNNRGMYDAHLHFELRRNILIGMHRHRFPRDFTSYWDPTSFITARSTLPGGAKVVSVPINTFNTAAGPVAEVSEDLPVAAKPTTLLPSTVPKPPVIRRTPFKVDRFQDLRDLE
jgi:murein DD-endopeptidase MepM/ murein hydrolase activator NlpD